MRENVVIRTVSRLSIPFIQLFALYVIVHGASGAGGGFQGGVVLASSFILLLIAFGLSGIRSRISVRGIRVFAAAGVFIYAGIGLLCIIYAGNFLGYGAIESALGIPHLHALLIDIVEAGIGITVMAVMISIILDFADKEGIRRD
ncbi:MAG: MnhB domain-containing protein [Methanoregulaceae archaeon]|jgi:multicomponent Na+:H+ antiporter subunit B